MRQPSLHELLGVSDPRRAGRPTAPGHLELYSYFSGAGGFCTGAAQAGCRVVYACDNCPRALETHRRNHPQTEHQCLLLPSPEAAARLPTDGRRFHVHCSPPCIKFSKICDVNAAKGNVATRGQAQAVAMVEWSLALMLGSRCTSWSMEQVASPGVVAALERAQQLHPGRVAWAKCDLSLLGVPQTRTRLIAGTPRLIACLERQMSTARRRTAGSVLRMPRGTHLRQGCSSYQGKLRLNRAPGQTKYLQRRIMWSNSCASLDGLAHTVRGRHAHCWVTIRDGKAISHCVMWPSELAALQTFPKGYKLPLRKSDAYLQVGNAVPPLVAKLLLKREARESRA